MVGKTQPSTRLPAPWDKATSGPTLAVMRPKVRKPLTERVAGWSARHRFIAVVGWLVLGAAAFTLGQHLGQGNVQGYDPGQAGQAERVLNRPVVQQPPAEQVLISGHAAGDSSASDPEIRQAVAPVVAAP